MTSEVTPPQADYSELTPYEKWMEAEGLPIIKGYAVQDLTAIALEPWPRRGGSGAFIDLIGNEQSCGTYLCEIPPGKSLEPEKHLYEERILILNGRGATAIWNEGGPKQTFEWHDWSLFAIPLNAWYQHFNGQGDKPVRYLAVTSAPMVMNLFHNMDFVLNNDFVFRDRYGGEEDYFSSKGKLLAYKRNKVLESNFIPDVRSIKLHEWKERGAGGTNIFFEMANNSMGGHISEFPVATYKKAHRHGAGAHVIMLSGKGYELMWPEGQPWVRLDWQTGSLFVPPDRWFHQHFDTSREPARYLALHLLSKKHPFGKVFGFDVSIRLGGDQIEYEDEDPRIRRLYEEELAKEGLELRMPPTPRK